MSRKRIYYNWEIPRSVVNIVQSICADYERRQKMIECSTTTEVSLDRIVELNNVVDCALEEIEPGIRKEIMRDITERRGYYRSGCCVIMDKNSYYRRRRKLVHDIAVTLQLI